MKNNTYKMTITPMGSENLKTFRITISENSYSKYIFDSSSLSFHNCQNFTMGNAQAFMNAPEIFRDRALTMLVFNLISKYQIIVDIRANKVSDWKKKMARYIKNTDSIKVMDYTSTNGTHMSLVYTKLDSDKISSISKSICEQGLDYFDEYKEPVGKQDKIFPSEAYNKRKQQKEDAELKETVQEVVDVSQAMTTMTEAASSGINTSHRLIRKRRERQKLRRRMNERGSSPIPSRFRPNITMFR